MSKLQLILGVDTSHKRGQLCLFEGSKALENCYWEKEGSHSEILNSKFQQLLDKHQLSIAHLDKIYCSVGPGSFTGLRVGVNFCKTLAYAQKIQLIPVNTLQALAHNCTEKGHNIITTIDAQKNSLFLSEFNEDKTPLLENQIVGLDELNNIIKGNVFLCGSGTEKYKNYLNHEILSKLKTDQQWALPDLCKIILWNEEMNILNPCSWTELQPLYIRLSSAEEKLKS